MTLLLHRKPQITLRNIRRSTPISRLATATGVLLVLSMAGGISADDALLVDDATAPAANLAVTSGETEVSADDDLSPLDKLKRRSALERWLEQQERLKKARIGRPAVPDIRRDGREVEPATRPDGSVLDVKAVSDDPFARGRLDLQRASSTQPAQKPVQLPSQLKKVTDILPYFDYEPDEETRLKNPSLYLCPRPDGKPCPPPAEGMRGAECPEEIPLTTLPYKGRVIADSVFNWEASNLYHNPLYFEDAPLERYGHTHHELIQPFVSAGKLGVQLLGLPYQMTIDPIHKRMYTLGWYRPGDVAPYKHYQIPWNRDAAAVEAGFMTGMFFLFP